MLKPTAVPDRDTGDETQISRRSTRLRNPQLAPTPRNNRLKGVPRLGTIHQTSILFDHLSRWTSHNPLQAREGVSSISLKIDGKLSFRRNGVSLDEFVEIHDKLHYGPSNPSSSTATTSTSTSAMTDFSRVMSLATVKVDNCFPDVEGLWTYLETLNLLDEERLRPGWDTYFMVCLSIFISAHVEVN